MLEEAIFAAENQRQLVFGASFMPIDKLKEQIEAISRESSPEDRIKHVRLMRKLSNYNDKLNKVSRALPLLFLQPILGTFSTVNGLMTSIEGIGITVFGGMPDFVQGHALDVFREHWPQISAIIYIDEAEADEIAERAGLKSILSLLGHGWDLYLLPLETRLRKAIPAIVLEVNYQNERLDKELELLKVLNLDSWSIGLH
ncbi:MAG: hypothetical protein D8M54_01515 [Chloroflexi bacterium]|nr:hypothetical protein [Chloroflexota bacterium]